jgi:hypothetical protein
MGILPPDAAPRAPEAVQARVESTAPAKSEQEEVAAALEELEVEHEQEERRKAGR